MNDYNVHEALTRIVDCPWVRGPSPMEGSKWPYGENVLNLRKSYSESLLPQ